jgi:hypothetical protein
MKRFILLPTLVLLFSSCGVSSGSQNVASSLEEKKAACVEYVRAYNEEANLDPFAADAREALDNPELTSANESLDSMLELLETDFPGITDFALNGATQEEIGIKYGQLALQAVQEYGQAFSSVDQLLRELCDGL